MVEGGLELVTWRGVSARERAIEVFSRLRVWDPEENTGVLIYVQWLDRRVEIVVDRGVAAQVAGLLGGRVPPRAGIGLPQRTPRGRCLREASTGGGASWPKHFQRGPAIPTGITRSAGAAMALSRRSARRSVVRYFA